jgi:hypothetical protein
MSDLAGEMSITDITYIVISILAPQVLRLAPNDPATAHFPTSPLPVRFASAL